MPPAKKKPVRFYIPENHEDVHIPVEQMEDCQYDYDEGQQFMVFDHVGTVELVMPKPFLKEL